MLWREVRKVFLLFAAVLHPPVFRTQPTSEPCFTQRARFCKHLCGEDKILARLLASGANLETVF